MMVDEDANLHVNVRPTAPLPEEFPDRQLVTGVSFISEGNSLVVEAKYPYTITTKGYPDGVSACLADGCQRAVVNGEDAERLLVPTRDARVYDGIETSASNLRLECRQFIADKLWACIYAETLQGEKRLQVDTFEDWVGCTCFILQHGLAAVQSAHPVFKVMSFGVTLRL